MKNTSLCYIEQDDKYFLLHRTKKEKDINKGKWIGFGGKFLENESPEECVRREVQEETGLILDTLFYRGIVTFVFDGGEGEYMHLFTSDAFHGTPIPCDEGETDWIKKSDIFTLPIWEGDRIFLKLLQTDCPFFSLKLCYTGDILTTAILNENIISTDH